MKNKTLGIAGFLVVFLLVGFVGMSVYASLTDTEITACVKKDGILKIVATDATCGKGENLLVWNVTGPQGPKGDKGDTGEPGLPAQHGAGNIAFITESRGFYADSTNIYLLKTDGSVWTTQDEPINDTENLVLTEFNPKIKPPIPVGDIVSWALSGFIDKDGNVWYFSQINGWKNLGLLP